MQFLSATYVRTMLDVHMEERRQLKRAVLAGIDAGPHRAVSCDHTFATAKKITSNGSKPYEAIFNMLNSVGEVMLSVRATTLPALHVGAAALAGRLPFSPLPLITFPCSLRRSHRCLLVACPLLPPNPHRRPMLPTPAAPTPSRSACRPPACRRSSPRYNACGTTLSAAAAR